MVVELGIAGGVEERRADLAQLRRLLGAAVNNIVARLAAAFLNQLPAPVQVIRSRNGRLHHVVAFLAGRLRVFQRQQRPAPSGVLLVEGSEALVEFIHHVRGVVGGREPLPFVADGAADLAERMLVKVRVYPERLRHVAHQRVVGPQVARHAAVNDVQLRRPHLLDGQRRAENPLFHGRVRRALRQQPVVLALVLLPLGSILRVHRPHQQQ